MSLILFVSCNTDDIEKGFAFKNISITVEGKGLINAENVDLSCETECILTVSPSKIVKFKAISADGYIFSHWAGDCYGDEECIISSENDVNIIAVFEERESEEYDQNQKLILSLNSDNINQQKTL
ncbi:MAG: hypothetical protein H6622_00460 [Halobacteriovoraceae bacterium]|nr:hypothetical protein [Halobacteriovoraceae bacterium]